MNNTSLDLKAVPELLAAAGRQLKRYAVPLFLLLVAGVYGFLAYRAVTLARAQPTDAAVTAQVKASAAPHINAAAAQQLQDLQDNSVTVRTLFDEARNNPFQE